MTAACYDVSGSGPDGASFFTSFTGSPITLQGLVFGSWAITVEGRNAESKIVTSGRGECAGRDRDHAGGGHHPESGGRPRNARSYRHVGSDERRLAVRAVAARTEPGHPDRPCFHHACPGGSQVLQFVGTEWLLHPGRQAAGQWPARHGCRRHRPHRRRRNDLRNDRLHRCEPGHRHHQHQHHGADERAGPGHDRPVSRRS